MEETNASPKKTFPRNSHKNKGKADKPTRKIKFLGISKLFFLGTKYSPKKNKAIKIEKS